MGGNSVFIIGDIRLAVIYIVTDYRWIHLYRRGAMTNKLPVGPYRTIELDNGLQAPFYIIPFDEQGLCQGPLTRENLMSTLQNGGYTDIFLFSHGFGTAFREESGFRPFLK